MWGIVLQVVGVGVGHVFLFMIVDNKFNTTIIYFTIQTIKIIRGLPKGGVSSLAA